MNNFIWNDNPMLSGVSPCNTDIVNDNLMHLKYENGNIGGYGINNIQQSNAIELSNTNAMIKATAVVNEDETLERSDFQKIIAVGDYIYCFSGNILYKIDKLLKFEKFEIDISTEEYKCLNYGNGVFYAVRYGYDTGYYYNFASSTDGISWTIQNKIYVEDNPYSDLKLVGVHWYASAYNEILNRYIILGQRRTRVNSTNPSIISFTLVATSEDGVNWLVKELTDCSITNDVVICPGKDLFVIQGHSYLYTTSDGITWKQTNVEAPNFKNIVYGNDRFVALSVSVYTDPYVYVSYDGNNWQGIYIAELDPSTNNSFAYTPYFICFGNNYFFIRRSLGYTYSVDGINWRNVSENEPIEEDLSFQTLNAIFAFGSYWTLYSITHLYRYEIKEYSTLLSGQWVYPNKPIMLLDETSLAAGYSAEFDLSEYLPQDNYQYEIRLCARLATGKSSGNTVTLWVGGDVMYDYDSTSDNSKTVMVPITGTITRASSSAIIAGTIDITVGAQRRLSVTGTYAPHAINYTNGGTGSGTLYIAGYRRIGANG